MIRFYVGERWKKFHPGYRLKLRYAVSNFGRLVSFRKKLKEGNLINGCTIEGYKIFRFKVIEKKKTRNYHLFFHHLVAKRFLRKKSRSKIFVLHLDHDKQNNAVENLKWATKREMIEHNKTSPAVIAARKKFLKARRKLGGVKLTPAQVRTIRKMIKNPRRRLTYKQIARSYGVTDMTLYRIKSGENWSHVK